MSVGAVARRNALPEVGQQVFLRGQPWIVSEVLPSLRDPDVLGESAEPHRTLVRLWNVGDHGLGSELEVVWEAEPGRRILDAATFPEVTADGLDDPQRLAAFLDAVRWGAVTSADVRTLQSPFRSGIQVEDYQLDPVIRALRSPRANLLIADDVGLGKTIEAGIVAQEMELRHRARTMMIVCPADLCLKWQREMIEKFGMDFTIVNSETLRDLRRSHGIYANPWQVYQRTIVSLPWLRGDRAQRLLNEVLPAEPGYPRKFDLLIVDEAHHCAPAGKGRYAVDSQQTRAVRSLSAHFEHRLFLTATPHNGYRESFTALLELVDPQRFTRGVEPSERLLAEVLVRRVKSDIVDWDGSPRFQPRVPAEPLEVDYPEDEEAIHGLLAEYTRLRKERLRTKSGERAVDMVTLLLKKRLFSSPAAFALTLNVHAATVAEQRADAGDSGENDYDDDAVWDWLDEAQARTEDDFDDEDAQGDAETGVLTTSARATQGASDGEMDLLRQMQRWAERRSGGTDAKAKVFLDWVESVVRPNGRWNDERIVIFTEYRDTQKYLANLLEAAGLAGESGERLNMLFGGQDGEERALIKEAFQAPPDRDPVRILLATDSASEGIDLQLHCHRILNYDIPFNPNRLEQRIGRLDRYLQEHPVEVFHFVGKGWRDAEQGSFEKDLEFLSRVATKVALIRDDLGKVNAVLAGAVEEHMTGKGTRDIDRIQQIRSNDLLRAERNLRDEIRNYRAQLDESIETLRVQPLNVERVVRTALTLDRQADLRPGTIPGTFEVPPLTGSWSTTTLDLPDPLTGEVRPITFDPAVARAHGSDVVLAHLGHRLVAKATHLLRAEVWGTSNRGLNRVSAAVVPDTVSNGAPALAAYSRLVLVAEDGTRLHEEIFAAGGVIRDGRWERLGVGDANRVLTEALDDTDGLPDPSVADRVLPVIADGWQRWQPLLSNAIDARAKERVTSLERTLDARRDADIERTEKVLNQLADTLRAEIDREPPELALFDLPETLQWERDLGAWRRRLAEIPAEIERETAQIRARYATARALTFPAAVLVCVPERLASSPRTGATA